MGRGEVEAQIERYIDDGEPRIPYAVKENIGRTIDFAAGRNRYIGYRFHSHPFI